MGREEKQMKEEKVWVAMGIAVTMGILAVLVCAGRASGKEAVTAVAEGKNLNQAKAAVLEVKPSNDGSEVDFEPASDCQSDSLNRSRCVQRRIAGVPGLVRYVQDGPTEQCREVYLKENGEPYGVIAVPCKVAEKAFTAAASGD